MEEWKQIKDYSNYSVSNKGNVRNNKTNRTLKFGLSGNSIKYHRVNLYNSNGMRGWNVHQLVYQAFNGKLLNGYVIDHIDNNPLNNLPENLKQITNRENVYKYSLNKGIVWDKNRNKWLVRIKHNNKSNYVGRYSDKNEAIEQHKIAFNNIVK